jgi:hypothetical protein
MNLRAKAVLINVGIAIGLLIMFYRGSPVMAIVIAGIFLFSLANVLMIVKAKKRK